MKIRVNISIDEADLTLLDGRAAEAKLDRSAYISHLLHPSGTRPMVHYNEDVFKVCQKVFKLEHPQHMVNYALSVLAKQAYERYMAKDSGSQETPDTEAIVEMD